MNSVIWLNFAKKIDRLNSIIGRTSAYITILMVVVTCLIAILRYVFNIGFIVMQESVIYMHSAAFMLPAAIALRKNYHVRVDIFYSSLPPQKKALIDMLGTLLILFPIMFFCFYISWPYVVFSWQYLEGSREAGGLDGVFLLKSLLLIMPILMILQGISELIKNYLVYKGHLPSTFLSED